MKKLFIVAAALAFGLGSCNKGPDNGTENGGVVSGDATHATLDLVLPAGNSSTRADPTYISGTAAESAVSSVHVFIFEDNAAANAVATGGYTNLTPLNDYYDFAAATTTNGVKTVPMKAGKFIPTQVGSVKVYVAFNLPTAVVTSLGTTGYTNEAAMLAELGTVIGSGQTVTNANGDSTSDDFTMFSEASKETFVAVPTDGAIPNSNKVSIDVSRVVSKALATYNASNFPANIGKTVTWTIDPADDNTTTGGVHLFYSVNHWAIYQDVEKTYLAPNWDGARRKTYLEGTSSGAWSAAYVTDTKAHQDDNISFYEQSIARNAQGMRGFTNNITNQEDPDDTGWAGTTTTAMYIGENMTRGIEALPQNTTLAWLSMRVQADAKAVWSSTTPTTPGGKIKWETATRWGSTAFSTAWSANDVSPTDIYVLRFGGRSYFTQAADVDNIVTGVAYNGAKDRSVRIMDSQTYPMSHVVNGVTTVYNNFLDWQEGPDGNLGTSDDAPDDTTLQGTDMSKDAFLAANPEFVVEQFIYYNGYVHFPFYINMKGSQADLTRNQLYHLNVDDFKAGVATSYKFPGYPGQDDAKQYPLNEDHPGYDAASNNNPWGSLLKIAGEPKVPMDQFGVVNNPQPEVPGTPIVPAQTQITVQVRVMPWGYSKQNITIDW